MSEPILDDKHKAIGATVSILGSIADVIQEGGGAPSFQKYVSRTHGEIKKLFTSEAADCDFKTGGDCGYFKLYELRENYACCIANCPLGELVNTELKELLSSMSGYIGPCTRCGKGVAAANLGHVDDHMQICKPCLDAKGM